MSDFVNPLVSGTILHGTRNRYRVVRPLGQGSFGITYLASVLTDEESETTNVTFYVAVKEFFMKDYDGREGSTVTSGRNDGETARFRRKFRREAKSLANLDHENIIKVSDAFDQNNTSYYVMEYVECGNLDNYIEKHGRLDEEDTLAKCRQIIAALSYMHAHGMLHLDLKPGNIMLRGDGTLLLIDFGLAKQYDEKGNPSSLTVGGGTPGYAPIEQADYREEGFPVTMDIYALGATMYKMLTGVRVPKASDVLAKGLPLDNLKRYKVSQPTIDIVVKSMQPTPDERYQTVGQMLKDVEKAHRQDPDPTPLQNFTIWTVIIIIGVLIGILFTCTRNKPEPYEDEWPAIEDVDSTAPYPIEKEQSSHWTKLGDWYGDYYDGKMQGEGTLYYHDNDPDGRDSYWGKMLNGKRVDDYAMLTYTNGNVYEGSFYNDHFTEGKFTWNTNKGMYFVGSFSHDKPYNGYMYLKDGTFYGECINGEVE